MTTEATLTKSFWSKLKRSRMTYDAVVRIAVRLIASCAANSGEAAETFAYAGRLLDRTATRYAAVRSESLAQPHAN